MANNFDTNKLYLFDINKYKKDIKKRIKKSKTIDEKNAYRKELSNGLKSFAKDLMERKYTFTILNEKVGLYTYEGTTYAIYPEWCKEVTLEEYRIELDSVKGGDL